MGSPQRNPNLILERNVHSQVAGPCGILPFIKSFSVIRGSKSILLSMISIGVLRSSLQNINLRV